MKSEKLIRLGGSGRVVEPAAETLEAALALSVATGQAFTWEKCRVQGSVPLKLFTALCGARIGEGSDLRFEPGPLRKDSVRLELESAEPLLRLVRAAALPLGLSGASGTLTLTGITHAPESETFEVSSSTWVHGMRKAGFDAALHLERAGFAPKGGGEVSLTFGARPDAIAPLELGAKGELDSLQILSAASSLPSHVQQRQAARARSGVAIAGIDSTVQLLKLKAAGSGSTVAVTGIFSGTPITVSAVSERGRSVEWVGERAAAEFRRLLSGSAVLPPALLPSLLLVAAFAKGSSRLSTYRLPLLSRSHAELVQAFTGRDVTVDGKPGGPGEMRVEGEVASTPSEAPY
jgi:RNA 3'-terminal phosphate cyclase (ATP)